MTTELIKLMKARYSEMQPEIQRDAARDDLEMTRADLELTSGLPRHARPAVHADAGDAQRPPPPRTRTRTRPPVSQPALERTRPAVSGRIPLSSPQLASLVFTRCSTRRERPFSRPHAGVFHRVGFSYFFVVVWVYSMAPVIAMMEMHDNGDLNNEGFGLGLAFSFFLALFYFGLYEAGKIIEQPLAGVVDLLPIDEMGHTLSDDLSNLVDDPNDEVPVFLPRPPDARNGKI